MSMGAFSLGAGASAVSSAGAAGALPWSFSALCGRLVEIVGGPESGVLSLCAGMLLEAQQQGGLCAWVQGSGSSVFASDLIGFGLDLDALAVVCSDTPQHTWKAADILLRSGGFALVLIDSGSASQWPQQVQTRLTGLAQHHQSLCLLLSRKKGREHQPGSLVSLRALASKRRLGHDAFACELRALKDKRRAPGWTHSEVHRGTDGLC